MSQNTQQEREQLRQQIRQTVLDAQQAAREAQVQGRLAQEEGRIVQQAARDAANQAAQVPGTLLPPPAFPQEQLPQGVENISIAFFVMLGFCIVGWPLARAFGRRIERRGLTAQDPTPQLAAQLQRIETAVEAMSIEVERISEGQRFATKILAEREAIPPRKELMG